MNKNPTCCAVVVTYNRKLLLEKCLQALLSQSYPVTEIIIIDNASTDGTGEHLDQCGLSLAPVRYLKQTVNSGGAGGFHLGVAEAVKSGCDYVWLMDDDGLPAADCLEQLFLYAEKADYIGPVVTDPQDPALLSFPLRIPASTHIMTARDDLESFAHEGLVKDILAPFNGVLLSKQMIDKIGLPDKKYFIWGDEIDYTQRVLAAGYSIATVLAANFSHPRVQSVGKKMFFGLMHFNDTDSSMKLFCLCRNNVYIKNKYFGKHYGLMFSVKVLWFYLFTIPSITKFRTAISALYAGWISRFDNNFR